MKRAVFPGAKKAEKLFEMQKKRSMVFVAFGSCILLEMSSNEAVRPVRQGAAVQESGVIVAITSIRLIL